MKVFNSGNGHNLACGGSPECPQKPAAEQKQTEKTGTQEGCQSTMENASSTGQVRRSVEKCSSGVEHKDSSDDTLLKTTLMITILFTVSWCPLDLYFFMLCVDCCGNFSMTSDLWYASLFIAYLSQCLHPFIYGAKLRNVRIYITNMTR